MRGHVEDEQVEVWMSDIHIQSYPITVIFLSGNNELTMKVRACFMCEIFLHYNSRTYQPLNLFLQCHYYALRLTTMPSHAHRDSCMKGEMIQKSLFYLHPHLESLIKRTCE